MSHSIDKMEMEQIRRQSTLELEIFKKRWEKAAEEDITWVDPYPESNSWLNLFSRRKKSRGKKSW